MGVTWNYRGYVCPWCGRLVEEHDYESEPETEYEVECPDCGRTFWAEYQLEPVLGTVLPEVMKVCAFGPEDQRCPRFDAFDCCCRGGNGWPEPEWCPKRSMDSEVD